MQVRIAQDKDINQISSVLATSWKTAYRGLVNDDYLDSLQSDHWLYFLASGLHDGTLFAMVVEDNQKIFGAAILSWEADGAANLLSFYLLPEYIGQGYGHVFFHGIEEELKQRNVCKCRLDVLEHNKRAIRFYVSHGFKDTGKRKVSTLGVCEYICEVFENDLCSMN